LTLDFEGAILEAVQEDGENPKIKGSLMLALAESKEEVLKALQEDVYYKSGIWDWEKVQIHPVCHDFLVVVLNTSLTRPKFKTAFWKGL